MQTGKYNNHNSYVCSFLQVSSSRCTKLEVNSFALRCNKPKRHLKKESLGNLFEYRVINSSPLENEGAKSRPLQYIYTKWWFIQTVKHNALEYYVYFEMCSQYWTRSWSRLTKQKDTYFSKVFFIYPSLNILPL